MNAVVIVAGGSGRRMGGQVPKQYLKLQGKAVIIRSLECFFKYDPGMKLVLVLAESHQQFWNKISQSSEAAKKCHLVFGGENRYDSVRNGLELIPRGSIVGIHDAVRPLVSQKTIERSYRAAAESGSGIPVVEIFDSVRLLTEKGSENLERSSLRRVQTPQVFKSELIKSAYDQSFPESVTDDASVYESLHGELTLVEGNAENIKITNATDLELASLFI